MPIVLVLSFAAFVSAFTIRMIDPLIPAIAREFTYSYESAAMLASAYTFPYALSQPVLGPLGDALGKARIIKICLVILAVALLAGAYAQTMGQLFAARVLAGIAGGGIIPLGFAIIGDRFDGPDRQVALSRLVMASQIAILLGSVAGGVIATAFTWRWMFVVPALLAAIVSVVAATNLQPRPGVQRQPLELAVVRANYRAAFAAPLARYCLIGVFGEGVLMFGLMPFIAGRLEQMGQGGLTEAGMIIAAVSVGGIAFTLAVRRLLAWLGRAGLIRIGGIILAVAFVGYAFSRSWAWQAVFLGIAGAGFFMMHNCLQALATELAPQARASGISLFAFIFFSGQAAGPVFYRFAFGALGPVWPPIVAALLFAALAYWVSQGLYRSAKPT